MRKGNGIYQGDEKEFIKVFRELCYSRQTWEVWADVITVMACSLANAVDRKSKRFEAREEEYSQCINRLGGVDKPAQIFAILVNALEKNPAQDYLGSLYMQLELGNHWKGQFFTPYSVCSCMAEINAIDCNEQIKNKGWISACDPCIGGGAMMIALANTFKRQNINYQNHVLFVGQDIDRIVGMMAYIQLSLLGCPGYIVIGDSIGNPMVGEPLLPLEQDGQEYWYTPFYHSDVWQYRRLLASIEQNIMYQDPEKNLNKEKQGVSNVKKMEDNVSHKSIQMKKALDGQLDLFSFM